MPPWSSQTASCAWRAPSASKAMTNFREPFREEIRRGATPFPGSGALAAIDRPGRQTRRALCRHGGKRHCQYRTDLRRGGRRALEGSGRCDHRRQTMSTCSESGSITRSPGIFRIWPGWRWTGSRRFQATGQRGGRRSFPGWRRRRACRHDLQALSDRGYRCGRHRQKPRRYHHRYLGQSRVTDHSPAASTASWCRARRRNSFRPPWPRSRCWKP